MKMLANRRVVSVALAVSVPLASLMMSGAGCQQGDPVLAVISPDGVDHRDASSGYLVINFGDVDSTLGVTKQLTLNNVGEGRLQVTEVCFVDGEIEGAADRPCSLEDTAPFSIDADTPYGLEPGDQATVSVTYTPIFNPPIRVLKIVSNDPTSPVVTVQVVGDIDIIPGSLSGCICNEGTGWVDGASLSLEHEEGALTGTTDEDGCFVFEQVPSGSRTLEVTSPDYSESFPLEITARKHHSVGPEECSSPAGAVVGCVCDFDNYQWLVGGDVRIDTEELGTLATTTDADGCFFFTDVPVGPQTVQVTGDGFSETFPVEIIGSEIVATETPATCEPPTGAVYGCPCDTSVYAPVPGATVSIETQDFGTVTGTVATDGCFLIGEVPFGSHTLTVTQGAYSESFPVDIEVGETYEVPGPAVCAQCSFEEQFLPQVTTIPVDVVFVIDSSGSMQNENDAVEDNLNGFSQAITATGLDHRVVTIGRAEAPPPLGDGPDYRHVETKVRSHDALLELLGHYDDYQGFLRSASKKHIVAITDDTSQLSYQSFTASLDSLDNPGFGDDWVFHSIVGYGNVPQVGCHSAAGIGDDYLALSAQTGGYTNPVCDADFTDVFDAIFEAVTFQGIPCTYTWGDPPDGSNFDPSNVDVAYSEEGAAPKLLPQDQTCANEGWRYDNPDNPTMIELCPASCEKVEVDKTGSVTLGLGCIYE